MAKLLAGVLVVFGAFIAFIIIFYGCLACTGWVM